jgi:hypothetical protein
MCTIFCSENLKGRDHMEGLSVDGNIILDFDLREVQSEGVDWMHLVQDRVQRWVPLNVVTNFRVS